MQIDQALDYFIDRHGVTVSYLKQSGQVYDPATRKVTSSVITTELKAYPKQIRANTYNYPDLVGQEVIMFYFKAKEMQGNSALAKTDSISYRNQTYKISSYQEHMYQGELKLYRVIAVKA
jgi:hypothetical protein